ncbi:energy-coupling factor ABC transporter substrate-binding protein [Propionivibrio dicarboxylicus]|uniref:Cobalt transport protein CbiN n=1 Tax=Propionivibrio dicarboxylicus TaxID=83767 RepID=A0A1G7WQ21_9RHOO|nr:energy-coupling factor ABC transporter substrate-binding protein [Propionivibrio dicarboxylicus]SDG74004.1 cobalt/nickel transport protein [Propionivibrio dicarboxylicus]
MKKRPVNLLLILGVVLLSALPLWLVQKPEATPGSEAAEIFTGADDKAKNMIGSINPDYKPWFSPIIEPASNEIASLLFALQAAIGAGVIGYYLGVSVTREKFRREAEKNAATPTAPENERSAD